MATRILIDGFVANPEEFYSFVIEEITSRELPDIKFGWSEDTESTRVLFNRGDKARKLSISCKGESIAVLGYQVGKCFYVSTRRLWDTENLKAGFLFHALRDCFETVVGRSVRKALSRHLESRHVPVPKFLQMDEKGELSGES